MAPRGARGDHRILRGRVLEQSSAMAFRADPSHEPGLPGSRIISPVDTSKAAAFRVPVSKVRAATAPGSIVRPIGSVTADARSFDPGMARPHTAPSAGSRSRVP